MLPTDERGAGSGAVSTALRPGHLSPARGRNHRGEPRTVALVVPALAAGGGVPASAAFVARTLEESGAYRPRLISLATSARDDASTRLLAPATWRRGVRIHRGRWRERWYLHVGAAVAELEWQRYRPRPALTRLLDGSDLVHIVCGTPAWANVARFTSAPVIVQPASRARVERVSQHRAGRGVAGTWRRLMTRVTSALEDRALGHVDAAVVINSRMLADVRRYLGPSRVRLLLPGVDTDLFHPCDTRSVSCGDYILAVGRWADPRKNVRLLFQAYSMLRASMEGAPRLVLAGMTMPGEPDWAFAAAAGVRPYVDARCDLSAAELAALYRGARLFVMSSDEEGLGIVLLEAMASGLPVVSTDSGGPAMVIQDGINGFLAPVGDAAALADRMEHLMLDVERSIAFGARNRRAAVERYSVAAAGRQLLDFYGTLLEELPGRPRLASPILPATAVSGPNQPCAE